MNPHVMSAIMAFTSIDNLDDMRIVRDAFKSRWAQLESLKQQEFKIGDAVEWTIPKGKNRGRYVGKVTGFKGNNVLATTIHGEKWSLGPSLVIRREGA